VWACDTRAGYWTCILKSSQLISRKISSFCSFVIFFWKCVSLSCELWLVMVYTCTYGVTRTILRTNIFSIDGKNSNISVYDEGYLKIFLPCDLLRWRR
jgi:hypothetical protein